MARRSRWGVMKAAAVWAMAALLAAGCGGGNEAPPPSEGQATVGAAGGTVQGPDGVQMSVPADALAQDVTLRIARDHTGAPPLPDDLPALSPVYAFTPHGIGFGDTVRVRVPHSASSQGGSPAFMYVQPGGRWTMLVNDVAAQTNVLDVPLTGFSWGYVADLGPISPPPGGIRHPMMLSLVTPAPDTLPFAGPSNSFRRLEQAQTIRIRAELAPHMTELRRAGSCVTGVSGHPNPRLELVRAIAAWPMSTPYVDPPLWITLPGAPVVGSANATTADFDVPMDHTHNGTAYFLVRLYCGRWRPDGTIDAATETNPMQFGFVVLRVGIPTPVRAPTITRQPQNVTAAEGAAATFSVAATAPDTLVVQWQRSDDGGATWRNPPAGPDPAVHTINPVQAADNGARLRASVCNQLGVQLNCITSDVATLTVASAATAPAFTQQPQSIEVVAGQTASFTAVASGNPAPLVQWFRVGNPDVAVGTPCTGSGNTTSCTHTTAPLSVSDSGARFRAHAENSAGDVYSDTVTLTVTAAAVAPSITTQPADQTVTQGASATFTVVADGTAPLSYQWYRNGQPIAGANGASYTLSNAQLADNGAQFSVEVSNSEGTVTSVTVTLTVTASSGVCSAPQPIESGAGGAAVPRVVLDAAGNATAVWSQDDGSKYSIFANRYSAGSGWGTEQVIDHSLANAAYAVMGMDDGGNLLAVWFGGVSVYANHYTAGSGWGGGVDWFDGTAFNSSTAPALALAAGGEGMAVWQRFDGTADSIYARQYTGGGWGPAQVIDSDGFHPASTPDVGVDASGNAIAVWRQSNGTTYGAYYNVFNGTEWGTAMPIATTTGAVQGVRIAMNATGQAVAIWSQDDGGAYGVYAATYAPGSGWGAPVRLDPGTTSFVSPAVAIDANGNAIAVWEQWDGVGHRIYTRRYVPGSGWTAIEQLQNTLGLGDAWQPSLAMDPSGNAIVVWMQWQSTTFGIFGNRYTPGSGWGGATRLADATNDVDTPRVALNASGIAMVVWSEGDGSVPGLWDIKAVRCQ